MCRAGKALAMMKGSLHTDELMKAAMHRDTGLRTARRISHVFIMDTPAYARTLLITDAAINIVPELEDKVHIVQNAIDLAHALGIPEPKVALLSAVETVNPKIKSTLDAAALCKMADRGQITGGILDGPLAFDTAVSAKAAAIKQLVSPVTGKADILVVPDLESGNMLAKQLEYLGGAQLAGIVLGARVPTILTSRADSAETRLTSCAVAVLLHYADASGSEGLGTSNPIAAHIEWATSAWPADARFFPGVPRRPDSAKLKIMPARLPALIFDLDGTLTDSKPGIVGCLQKDGGCAGISAIPGRWIALSGLR